MLKAEHDDTGDVFITEDDEMNKDVIHALKIEGEEEQMRKLTDLSHCGGQAAGTGVTAVEYDGARKRKVEESADAILNQICNLILQFAGKPKQLRYSPEVLRMAISVDNKSKKLIGTSVLLDWYKYPFNVKIGCGRWRQQSQFWELPTVVRTGRATYGSGPLDGQLVADEMNVTCSIVWNSVTHDIWGFVDDELTLDGMVTSALSEEKKTSSLQIK